MKYVLKTKFEKENNSNLEINNIMMWVEKKC